MSAPDPLRFLPSPALVCRVRQEARAIAVGLGAREEVCDALALVVDELVNNAIEHGAAYRTAGHELTVAIWREGEQLVLEFRDPEMPGDDVRGLANALRDAANGTPSLDSERGRGLFLVSVYLEEVSVDIGPGGGLHLRGRLAG